MEARMISEGFQVYPKVEKQKTITMPAVQSMIQYLLKHHKRKILSALNHSLAEGALDRAFGRDVSGHKVSADCVEFIGMEYWRLDMYNVLVDMNLAVTLTLADGSKTVQLYGEIYVDGHHQFQFNFGNFGAYKDRPDRDLIRMSSYLVPYLRKNDLEKEMELLLAKHDLSDIEGGATRRAMLLAKRMGLRVQSMCLCNHDKTESVLFFQESRVLVYVRNKHGEEEETEMQTVPANTIVINERVLHGSNCDAPIFHECVHYELHFLFYRLQQMYHDNDVSRVRTKKLIVKNGKVPKDPLKWMEWQAQRGAYALMMPQFFFHRQVRNELANCCVSFHEGVRLDTVGRGIAKDYDIPKSYVRARMLQLGYTAAEGALNYVDDHYIEPFALCNAKYEQNHTFVIKSKGLREVYENDADFRKRLDGGSYVYADGHIVINDPRYVKNTWYGPRLTAWANANVDLCCLRFMHVYEVDDDSDLREFYYGALHSDEDYNHHFFAFVDSKNTLSDPKKNEAMLEVINAMPDNFADALTFLMKKTGHTEETFASAVGLSVPTIHRRRKQKYVAYTAEQIVPLCLALHLPPPLSMQLLSIANVHLDLKNPQHLGYQIALTCLYMDDMLNIQDRLTIMGLKKFDIAPVPESKKS